MFCTNCGRELPKDGTPCICGSGQAEPVQNSVAEEEWAGDTTALNWENVEPNYQPAEEQPEEEDWAGETTALNWEDAQPAYQEPKEEEWAGDTTALSWDETQPTYTQPEQPVNPYIQQPYVQQPPVYQQPSYTAPSYAVQGGGSVLDVIRGVASSPIFMIAAIVMSVHLLLSIIKAFVPFDIYGIVYSIVPMLESIMPGMGVEMLDEIEPMIGELYAAQAMLGALSLPSMIMPALTVAALWMIFISAKKPAGPKTGGFTILQVLQIISLVGTGLGILLAIIVIIVVCMVVMMLIEEMSYYGMGGGENMTGVIIAVMIIAIIAVLASVALSLVYSIKVLTSIINAKKAIKNGVVEKTASKFVMIYNFAAAAILVIDIFGTISMMGWMSGLVNLCAAGANVLFALCIMQYNKAIKPLITPKNAAPQMPQQPTYPQY